MDETDADQTSIERLEELVAKETEQAERLVREVSRLSEELAVRQARLRVLHGALESRRRGTRVSESPAMYSRAMAMFERSGMARADTTLAEAARFVLRKLERPAHYKEILAEIEKTGLGSDVSASGLLNAMRRNNRFVRVERSPGYWALAEWDRGRRRRIDPTPMANLRRERELLATESEIANVEARVKAFKHRQEQPSAEDAGDKEYTELLLAKEEARLEILRQRLAELREGDPV